MRRIKSYIKSAFSYPRKLWAVRPATAVSVITATALAAVWSYLEFCADLPESPGVFTDFLLRISIAAVYVTVFALCIESLRTGWGMLARVAAFAFFGFLSLLMSFVNAGSLEEYPGSIFRTALITAGGRAGSFTIRSYIIGLLASAVLLAVYFSHKYDIRQKFNEHVLNCSANIFFSSIILGVIQIGIVFLVMIVNALLYDGAFDYLIMLLILINGLFYAPAVLCALTQENEMANVFFRSLVRYVMLTISMLAYVIIYIYIMKLTLTRSVPSNSVYAILAVLFVISMFISYICTAFGNTGILQKFAYICPLFFSPFIIMQCYTVYVRIRQYGLTPKRYFGVAFILFEILYILCYIIKYLRKREIIGRGLLLILFLFIAFTVFMPGISAVQLSTILAKSTLSSCLEKIEEGSDISGREYIRANAAVGFLSDVSYGRGRLKKYFPQFDEDARMSLRDKALEASKALREGSFSEQSADGSDAEFQRRGWYSAELFELIKGENSDIGGYNEFMYVNIIDQAGRTQTEKGVSVDPSRLDVYIYDGDQAVQTDADPFMTIDLKDYIRKFMAITADYNANSDYEEAEKEYKKISVIDVGGKFRLYITQAEISWDEEGRPVNVVMGGYLFNAE